MGISEWSTKIKAFVKEYTRVLKVTKKPNQYEFKTIVKVSAIGMLIIGLIGFILVLVKQLLMA